MRYYMDWEFLEDGRTIEPISVGIVCEDGRELYLINHDLVLDRLKDFPWVAANVVPYLPLLSNDETGEWEWDSDNPEYEYVMQYRFWAETIQKFLTGSVELWGYFSAYDHIALAQCFGRMIDLPANVPMWTNDIQQFATEHGFNVLDVAPVNGSQHNALADAGWTMVAHQLLMAKVRIRHEPLDLVDPNYDGPPGKPCLPIA